MQPDAIGALCIEWGVARGWLEKILEHPEYSVDDLRRLGNQKTWRLYLQLDINAKIEYNVAIIETEEEAV